MQTLTIAGRIARDAEQRQTQGGRTVCNFTVPVDQGWGENKQTNWYRCALWGKRAESLGPHLLKGVNVTVVGQLKIGEYNGKPQYEIDVAEIALQGGRTNKPSEISAGGGSDDGYGYGTDDSGDVPF